MIVKNKIINKAWEDTDNIHSVGLRGRLIQITYTVKNVINIYSGRSEKPFLICISAFGITKMSALKNSLTFRNIVTSHY